MLCDATNKKIPPPFFTTYSTVASNVTLWLMKPGRMSRHMRPPFYFLPCHPSRCLASRHFTGLETLFYHNHHAVEHTKKEIDAKAWNCRDRQGLHLKPRRLHILFNYVFVEYLVLFYIFPFVCFPWQDMAAQDHGQERHAVYSSG